MLRYNRPTESASSILRISSIGPVLQAVASPRRRPVTVLSSLGLAVALATPAGLSAGPAGAAARGSTDKLTAVEGCLGQVTPQPAGGRFTEPSSKYVHLPQDEAAHHQLVEWWYFSGHLAGTDATGQVRCYGFEYVTFQVAAFGPLPIYLGNFAVTDLSRGTFHYGSQTASYPVPSVKSSFSLHTGPWSMTGGNGHDVLRAELDGYRLDLQLGTREPAVLESDQGLQDMGAIGSSKYYSWTWLRTTGTMVDHGVPMKVLGVSWMDHQWGPMNLNNGAGWDWFSVQLANGYQYMVYFMRKPSGAISQTFGTRVSPNGHTQRLVSVSEKSMGTWKSPRTGTIYSSGWRLSVPGGVLDVRPDLLNQELDFRASLQHNAYWEGDVGVVGHFGSSTVPGVGYTELNPPAR